VYISKADVTRDHGVPAQKLLDSRLNARPILNQLSAVCRIQGQKSGEKAKHCNNSIKACGKEQCNNVGYHIIT
jgi:hypothetical protein